MGYELETNSERARWAAGWRAQALEQRWARADARLASALAEYARVRRGTAPDDPRLIAAQLGLAQARLRWHECAEEAESLSGATELLETG
jgi:hypothetical protein